MKTQPILNFISEEERQTLLDWALDQESDLSFNGDGRKFKKVSELSPLPLITSLAQKARLQFNLGSQEEDVFFGHYLSFNKEGAFIHIHKDPVVEGADQHIRINLVLQAPTSGGSSIYRNELLHLKNSMAYLIQASEWPHGSTPVEGEKDRIILSFGFQYKQANVWQTPN